MAKKAASKIVYIAYTTTAKEGIVPVSENGVIKVFPDTDDGYEEAHAAKGSLCTVSALSLPRLMETAKRYGLKVPKKGT